MNLVGSIIVVDRFFYNERSPTIRADCGVLCVVNLQICTAVGAFRLYQRHSFTLHFLLLCKSITQYDQYWKLENRFSYEIASNSSFQDLIAMRIQIASPFLVRTRSLPRKPHTAVTRASRRRTVPAAEGCKDANRSRRYPLTLLLRQAPEPLVGAALRKNAEISLCDFQRPL